MKLSIVIPTIGRAALCPLLGALRLQCAGKHEIIVIQDGHNSMSRIVKAHGGIYGCTSKSHNVGIGSFQRNIGAAIATGTHLAFLDDDDEIAPDYIQKIERVVQDSNTLHLFRVLNDGAFLWSQELIKLGNVSTQMLVVPRTDDLPLWRTDIYESDFYFISECAEVFKTSWHLEYLAKRGIGTGVLV